MGSGRQLICLLCFGAHMSILPTQSGWKAQASGAHPKLSGSDVVRFNFGFGSVELVIIYPRCAV